MDYTKVPRILIYKERSFLEDFGVYEPKSFNATLYEALMSLDDLKPRYEGVFGEILRLFNEGVRGQSPDTLRFFAKKADTLTQPL